ncbi:DUF975 family protein [Oscillibacter sp.]|uniref:DUF975 family protein n=1 Tax=Oscillibacter sp. TaxID=1945593 RepID=UPI003398EAA2
MAEVIDRPGLKAEMKGMLRDSQVSAKGFVALYLLLGLILSMVDSVASSGGTISYGNPLGIFVRILTSLLSMVLSIGFILYCSTVRQGQRAEYLTLFDGFSFVGKVIGLAIVQTFFILLWACLFIIPGIIAAYRYQFAYFNLCENPELGCMDALELSKKQTMGYKGQLFTLDLSYLGWELLASLPITVWGGYLATTQSPYLLSGAALEPVSTGVSLGIDLLCGLWAVAIQIFYLPTYQCTQLGYYETAKRTSGVSPLPSVNQPGIDDGGSDDLF